jgi:hypothetical protein
MNKDDWKAFFCGPETASDEELERRLLAVANLAETFREEGARADARTMQRKISLELEARRAVR